MTIENRVVCLAGFQSKGLNNVAELYEPSMWRLLETIERAG